MSQTGPTALADVEYGGLEQATGFLLRMAQLRVFAHFHKLPGQQDLRLGAMSALILIGRNPGIRHGILADALAMKLAHTTKMLNGLEARGLVSRQRPAHDRRSIELYLTESGQTMTQALRQLIARHEEQSVAGLTERERRQLQRLLRKFIGMPPLPRSGLPEKRDHANAAGERA